MRPSSAAYSVSCDPATAAFPPTGSPVSCRYCDRLDGDIDTISNRISHIRTWTFVANRTWLADPVHWQLRTREIEDKLSDALHERLTQRFIDRRTSVLMKRIEQREALTSTVEHDGAIQVEGECVGHMRGLTFVPAEAADDAHERALRAASAQGRRAQEVEARAQAIAASPDPDLSLSRDGQLIWQSASIARAGAGPRGLKAPHRAACRQRAFRVRPRRRAIAARALAWPSHRGVAAAAFAIWPRTRTSPGSRAASPFASWSSSA